MPAAALTAAPTPTPHTHPFADYAPTLTHSMLNDSTHLAQWDDVAAAALAAPPVAQLSAIYTVGVQRHLQATPTQHNTTQQGSTVPGRTVLHQASWYTSQARQPGASGGHLGNLQVLNISSSRVLQLLAAFSAVPGWSTSATNGCLECISDVCEPPTLLRDRLDSEQPLKSLAFTAVTCTIHVGMWARRFVLMLPHIHLVALATWCQCAVVVSAHPQTHTSTDTHIHAHTSLHRDAHTVQVCQVYMVGGYQPTQQHTCRTMPSSSSAHVALLPHSVSTTLKRLQHGEGTWAAATRRSHCDLAADVSTTAVQAFDGFQAHRAHSTLQRAAGVPDKHTSKHAVIPYLIMIAVCANNKHTMAHALKLYCWAHLLSASVTSLRETSELSALRFTDPTVPTEVIMPMMSKGACRHQQPQCPHNVRKTVALWR